MDRQRGIDRSAPLAAIEYTASAEIVEMLQPTAFAVASRQHLLTFLLKGAVRIDGTPRKLAAGHVNFIPAAFAVNFEVDGGSRFLFWKITPDTLDRLARAACDGGRHPTAFQPIFNIADDTLWHLGSRLAAELVSPGYGARIYLESLHLGLVIQLLRRLSPQPVEGAAVSSLTGQKLKAVLRYIHDHLSQNIALKTLAREAGLNLHHFAKCFKKATGRSPHQFIIEERVKRAKAALEDAQASLVGVALDVGFSSQSHFTSAFRRLVGVTPKAYRNARLAAG